MLAKVVWKRCLSQVWCHTLLIPRLREVDSLGGTVKLSQKAETKQSSGHVMEVQVIKKYLIISDLSLFIQDKTYGINNIPYIE